MKYLVVALFAVFVAVSAWVPKTAEGIRDIHGVCTKESELTPEQVEKVENFEFPDEDQVHKYVFCFGQKLRLFCRHAGYHSNRLLMQMDLRAEDDEVNEVLDQCLDRNEQKSSVQVWAYRGQQCILKSKLGDEIRGIFKQQKEKLTKKDASTDA